MHGWPAMDSSMHLRIKSVIGNLPVSGGILQEACAAPTVLFMCLPQDSLICACCQEWSRAAALSQRGKSQRARAQDIFYGLPSVVSINR